MIRRIRLAVVVVSMVVVQTTIFPHLRIAEVAPDLALLATVAVAYRAGPETGACVGFAAGLAVDLFLRTPLGLSALAWALTGYGIGVLEGGLLRSSRWIAPVLGGLGGLVGGTIFVLVGALVGQEQLFSAHAVRVVLIVSVYDALLAPFVFPLAGWALRDSRARAQRAATPSGWGT